MLVRTGGQKNSAKIVISLRLIEDTDALRDLADDWRALESASTEPCFFSSYAWCGHVGEMMARLHPTSYRPLVAVASSAERVSAIWPLSLQRSFGLWSLRNLDEPFGQMAGILAADQRSADALVAATFASVHERRIAASARFERVEIGTLLHHALSKAGATPGGSIQAPVVEVGRFQSFEALLASRKKKTRRNLRTATNRIARVGRMRSLIVKDEERMRTLILKTFENRRTWLSAAGLTSPAFRVEGHGDILTGGEAWGLASQRIGFELLLDERSIAQQWGFVHAGRYYAYMSGMDPGAGHLSPGSLHLAQVIEAAMAEGVEALELLTPASPYKMRWADSLRDLVDMSIDFTPLGRAKSRLWDRCAHPLFKAGFYRLPAFVRRRLEH